MEPPLVIGCVPEHFSAPLFQNHSQISIQICRGGTGEMLEKMERKEVDVFIALTEGLVSYLAKDASKFKIIGTLTKSPLTWTIAGKHGTSSKVSSLKSARIGISRFGSGSHIIPFVLAAEQAFEPDFEFVELKDITGLIDGISSNVIDAFLWEKFTTNRYLESNQLSCISTVTPPWPAFMIAARTEVLDNPNQTKQINQLMENLSSWYSDFSKQTHRQDWVDKVCTLFEYTPNEVRGWFETVKFMSNVKHVDKQLLQDCLDLLKKANVIEDAQVDILCFVDKNIAILK